MAITLLPTPPSRQDPINFNVRADEFLGALPTFGTEANSLATDVNNKQVTASNAATTATASASKATTKASEALSSANEAATSASNANTAKLAAEAALDSFDDRYLGDKSADPTTDNDGGALLVGALYFRTSAPIGMKVWTGDAWDDAYTNLSSKFDKTGGDVDGNINITGGGRRITGDFSNATLANRLMFQTNVVNGPTSLAAVPNGTGSTGQFSTYNGADVDNATLFDFRVNLTDAQIRCLGVGSGANLPMVFHVGGSERLRIDQTTGNILATGGALGYGVGAGGQTSQTSSRTEAVTLNKPCGRITMASAAGSPAPALFAVNNSFVASNDTIVLSLRSGAVNNYVFQILGVTAGQFVVQFHAQAGTAVDQPVLEFALIKAVVS